MKAVRYYQIHDVRVEEIEKPAMKEDEAFIKILYAGICGSDLHIYNKGMFIQNIPETMGHEFVGVVEHAGALVKNVKPGDFVVANPMVPCMDCPGCRSGLYNTCSNLGFIGEVRQGCFAEYISLPANTLAVVPPKADMKQMALAEPLAVALNVCERAQLTAGDELAVIGVGPIGLLTILAARTLYGVTSITAVGRSEERLKLAQKLGASTVGQTLPNETYFTKIVEAAGKEQTIHMAIDHTAPNGSIYVVSIFEDLFQVDLNRLVGAQISLVGCNAYEHRHIETAIAVIAEQKLDLTPLISETLDLAEGKRAFELLNRPDKKAAKILLKV